jgi:hypothetical protein
MGRDGSLAAITTSWLAQIRRLPQNEVFKRDDIVT